MKLTRLGIFYLLGTAVITLAATNTKTNLLHMFNAFLLALFLVSWSMLRANLRGTKIRVETPEEIFSGEAFPLRYLVANQESFAKFALSLVDPIGQHDLGIIEIPGHSTVSISGEACFFRRGLHRWGEIQLHSSFPFGFFEQEKKIPGEHEILVLPKPLGIPSMDLTAQVSMFREGNFTAVTRTASQDFAGLREYRRGDHSRGINWKASAKADRLIVQEYEDELPAGVSVILVVDPSDLFDANFPEIFEKAITATASLVWEIAHAGYLILFAYGEHLLRYGRGPEHALCILRILARADHVRDSHSQTTLQRSLAQVPGNSTAILLFFHASSFVGECFSLLVRNGCRVIGITMTGDIPTVAGVGLYRYGGDDGETLALEKS